MSIQETCAPEHAAQHWPYLHFSADNIDLHANSDCLKVYNPHIHMLCPGKRETKVLSISILGTLGGSCIYTTWPRCSKWVATCNEIPKQGLLNKYAHADSTNLLSFYLKHSEALRAEPRSIILNHVMYKTADWFTELHSDCLSITFITNLRMPEDSMQTTNNLIKH